MLPHRNDLDVAWAAGIYEGEGTIGCWKQSKTGRMCVHRVIMTDRDIMDRYFEVLTSNDIKASLHHATKLYGKESKLRSGVSTSNFRDTEKIVTLFWSWLGERRKEQATKALCIYKEFYSGRYGDYECQHSVDHWNSQFS